MPDYTPLIGKLVRTAGSRRPAVVTGRLESFRRIEDSACISVWIRRRSGVRVLVSGRFELERVPR